MSSTEITRKFHSPDGDYLARLRASMADSAEAKIILCKTCGRLFFFRCWPDDGPDALAAFLDGLAALAETTGCSVYGLWLTSAFVGGNTPCQLWFANDRTLISESTLAHTAVITASHTCTF